MVVFLTSVFGYVRLKQDGGVSHAAKFFGLAALKMSRPAIYLAA